MASTVAGFGSSGGVVFFHCLVAGRSQIGAVVEPIAVQNLAHRPEGAILAIYFNPSFKSDELHHTVVSKWELRRRQPAVEGYAIAVSAEIGIRRVISVPQPEEGGESLGRVHSALLLVRASGHGQDGVPVSTVLLSGGVVEGGVAQMITATSAPLKGLWTGAWVGGIA